MPKLDSDFAPRPALPDGSRALRPQVVVAEALMALRDALFEEAVATGDTELRDALVYVTFSRLIEEAGAAQAEVERTTGLTKPQAERVVADRLRKAELTKRHGNGWYSLIETLDYNLDKRGESKPAKRSAA
jgi:hypothetical protein